MLDAAYRLARPDTVGVVGKSYTAARVGGVACDRSKLSAFPYQLFVNVRIVAVFNIYRIPDRVVGYVAVGFLVVDQSVAPARRRVGIAVIFEHASEIPESEGIDLLRCPVPRVVIVVGVRIPGFFVVLANQLIQVVVCVARAVGLTILLIIHPF